MFIFVQYDSVFRNVPNVYWKRNAKFKSSVQFIGLHILSHRTATSELGRIETDILRLTSWLLNATIAVFQYITFLNLVTERHYSGSLVSQSKRAVYTFTRCCDFSNFCTKQPFIHSFVRFQNLFNLFKSLFQRNYTLQFCVPSTSKF